MGADAKLAVADPLRAGHQALSRGGVEGRAHLLRAWLRKARWSSSGQAAVLDAGKVKIGGSMVGENGNG